MSKEYVMQLEATIQNLRRDNQLLKEELSKYKSIDNANPSEAFETVYNNIDYLISDIVIEDDEVNGCLMTIKEQLPTIKQALLKAQEQEKENAEYKRVLKIVFEKQVDLGWLWYCIHECINSLNEYNKKMPIEKFKLTQEEFSLLKEVQE